MSSFIFDIVSFVILLILVCLLIHDGFKNIHEKFDKRDEELFEHLNDLSLPVIKATRLVAQHQEILNDNTNKLVSTLHDFNTFLNLKLRDIELLVESDLRSARQEELTRTREYKAILERIMSMNNLARQPPIGSDILALESATQRIEELEHILNPERSPSE